MSVRRPCLSTNWLDKKVYSADQAVLVDVESDSMEPTLDNSCTVMVDLGSKRFTNGEIYDIGINDLNSILSRKLNRLTDSQKTQQ